MALNHRQRVCIALEQVVSHPAAQYCHLASYICRENTNSTHTLCQTIPMQTAFVRNPTELGAQLAVDCENNHSLVYV